MNEQQLLWEARKPVEARLQEKMMYMERNEFKNYVKIDDIEEAFRMMRDTLPSVITDESIRNACHYIGNTLHHAATDLAKDPNHRPKRKIRSSSQATGTHDNENSSKMTTDKNAVSALQPMGPDQATNPATHGGEAVPAEVHHGQQEPSPSAVAPSALTADHPAADSGELCIAGCKHGRREAGEMVRCASYGTTNPAWAKHSLLTQIVSGGSAPTADILPDWYIRCLVLSHRCKLI